MTRIAFDTFFTSIFHIGIHSLFFGRTDVETLTNSRFVETHRGEHEQGAANQGFPIITITYNLEVF